MRTHELRDLRGSGKRWLRVVGVVVLVSAIILPNPVAAASVNRSALSGAKWLAGRQQANGAFFTGTQEADMTGATLAAVVAGGVRGTPVDRALDYIEQNGQSRATRGAFTGRIIAGIVASGADPRDFRGVNYVDILAAQYNPTSGAFDSTDLLSNLIAVNGALAAKEVLPQLALDYIRSNQCPDEGFGSRNQCESGPDVDASAWAINVLVAAGRASEAAVGGATDYIRSVQNDDGGFGRTSNASTNADSTGLAVSAIWALGQKPTKNPWRQPDRDNPLQALADLQHGSGGFRTFASDSEPSGISTVNAVPARAAVAYPIPAGLDDDSSAPGTGTKRTSKPGMDSDETDETEGERDEDRNALTPGPAEHAPSEPRQDDLALASSASDRTGSPKSADGEDSYSKPVPYEDPTSRRRLLAWAGLVTSVGMVGSGVRLFRYTRAR